MSTICSDNSVERDDALARVERAFAALGLAGDEESRARARRRARAGAGAEASAGGVHAAALSYACRLLVDAAPALAGETARTARLLEELERVLGLSRARLARELLGRSELALLAPAFTNEALLALVEASERRLVRFGYDLHDGPMQELLLLAEDLRLFREQIGAVLAAREERELVLGRIEDLDGRLVALEASLRGISTAAHASALSERPLLESLREMLGAFTTRTGVAPSLRLDGETGAISLSQRIALLSVVGEALNNVREHARGVGAVQVAIACGADGVDARVVDDGCGFDVERALVDAARRGRMGLVGINERVRLLGGVCAVDSRPGGPTTVALSLPRWEHAAVATSDPRAGGRRRALPASR